MVDLVKAQERNKQCDVELRKKESVGDANRFVWPPPERQIPWPTQPTIFEVLFLGHSPSSCRFPLVATDEGQATTPSARPTHKEVWLDRQSCLLRHGVSPTEFRASRAFAQRFLLRFSKDRRSVFFASQTLVFLHPVSSFRFSGLAFLLPKDPSLDQSHSYRFLPLSSRLSCS